MTRRAADGTRRACGRAERELSMDVVSVETRPIEGQKPGTSGLRKKVPVFQAAALRRELRPGDLRRARGQQRPARSSSAVTGATSTARRSRSILRMAAANGFGRVLVGRGGLLSTPAASCVIRATASLRRHHPLGRAQSRRPGRRLRHQVQHRQRRARARGDHRGDLRAHDRRSTRFKTLEAPDIDLDTLGSARLGDGDDRGDRPGRRLRSL